MLRTYGGQHNCNDIYVKGALSLLSPKKCRIFLNAKISLKSKCTKECEKCRYFIPLWHVRVGI